jgi:aspartyl-tRNA(Asn)/glutamyl-tRNA(Gln) amidotransferase subunit A
VKRRIMLGTYALSSGYYDAYYGTAQKVRTVIKREHNALFERFDVLASPTCATTAFPVGAKSQDPLAMYLTDLLTIPANMAGLPGISVPCGLSDGLPVGLQLIGPQLAVNTIFRAAHALETALEFDFVPERLR